MTARILGTGNRQHRDSDGGDRGNGIGPRRQTRLHRDHCFRRKRHARPHFGNDALDVLARGCSNKVLRNAVEERRHAFGPGPADSIYSLGKVGLGIGLRLGANEGQTADCAPGLCARTPAVT